MRPVHAKLLSGIVVVALAGTAITPAEAKRFRIGGGLRAIDRAAKNYAVNTLTPAQLKSCLTIEDRLEKANTDLKARHEAISRRQAEIELRRSMLNASQAALDRTSQKSVDAFNAQVSKLNATIQSTSAASAEYNRSVEAQKLENVSFNRDCGGKRYYEDDLITARTELGLTD
ncbi:hypothetical protein [Bosea sp. (in: a-proteobacteria)]|uniref:hypothetical protein n=1 Tax=Bosea sp. (in: a-proteobacteria) TaxID=1871050 RepID=UPI002735C448|nr:hypothetical protein [Bosea sp. (in: a-proteobacteria)]MDP3411550.1 hypothetical protein [Bosea sp. (in: a-proteobacteria)]